MKPQLSKAQLRRRREIQPHWLWYVLLAYVLFLAFMQGSFAKLGGTYAQILVALLFISVAIALVEYVVERPAHGIAIVLLVVTVAGLYFSESYRYGWGVLLDVLAFVAGIVMAAAVLRIAPQRWRERWRGIAKPKWHGVSLVAMVIAGWAALCVGSAVRQTTLPANPERFAQIAGDSIVPEYSQRWASRRIGVALSGGGYRAAVFHAGTLHALETLGLRPSVLSTVSGGSIIGAYYAIGGDPVAFKDAVIQGRFNLKRELLMLHNAARLPFPMSAPLIDVTLAPLYSFSRSDAQANLLRSALFRGRESWRTPGILQPRLIIATTEMTYGMQVGLIPEGIVTRSFDDDRRVYQGQNIKLGSELDLAERVAVSGAFPIAFPTKSIDAQVVSCSSSGKGTRSLRLSDGGIADNLGLQLLETVQSLSGHRLDCYDGPDDALSDAWAIDAIIVSNGGAIFGVDDDVSGMELLSRAFDISSANTARAATEDGERPVMVSAAGGYLDPHRQFLLHDDKIPRAEAERRAWRLNFDPSLGYPPSVLAAIVDLLPPEDQERAETERESYVRAVDGKPPLNGEMRGKWAQSLRIASGEECRISLQSDAASELYGLPGICEAVALREILEPHAFAWFQAFQRTSTLNDWPPSEDVEAVFRLAQLLTYREWLHLDRTLSKSPP